MVKIITPVSNFFKTADARHLIMDSSDGLECRDHTVDFNSGIQEVFHCELQPIHKISEEEFNYLHIIKSKKRDLKLISFHAASCYSNPVIIDKMFQPGGKKYTRLEMLDLAKNNFERIKKIFGSQVKLAIENNNHYNTEAYQLVTDPDFISDVVHQNDIHFLFDMAHAKISAHNKGLGYDNYKEGLPLDKCIQLHICKYDIDSKTNLAFDAHHAPDQTEFEEIKELIKKYPIEYLTVEYYKDLTILLNSLKELRKLL